MKAFLGNNKNELFFGKLYADWVFYNLKDFATFIDPYDMQETIPAHDYNELRWHFGISDPDPVLFFQAYNERMQDLMFLS